MLINLITHLFIMLLIIITNIIDTLESTLLLITLLLGTLFIILQLKEFLYSYFSLSDSLMGSIYYFTTGLHGFHVLLGSVSLFLIFCSLLFNESFFFIEFSSSLFLSSFYWHFVDFIWFIVFILFILIIVLINNSY